MGGRGAREMKVEMVLEESRIGCGKGGDSEYIGKIDTKQMVIIQNRTAMVLT
jgi:hypothetical protein